MCKRVRQRVCVCIPSMCYSSALKADKPGAKTKGSSRRLGQTAIRSWEWSGGGSDAAAEEDAGRTQLGRREGGRQMGEEVAGRNIGGKTDREGERDTERQTAAVTWAHCIECKLDALDNAHVNSEKAVILYSEYTIG
jgi:hypothetical protein